MTQQPTINMPSMKAELGHDFIVGKSLKFYWQAIKWFIVLLVVLDILNAVLEVYKHGHWIIEAAVFIIFSFYLLKRWRVALTTAITASVFLGIISGLLLAIFDIIWYHQWWYLLNFIRLPCIIGAVGVATSLAFYLLFQNIKFKQSKDVKGGGIYGRKKTNLDKFR
jgi:hypothetical protein